MVFGVTLHLADSAAKAVAIVFFDHQSLRLPDLLAVRYNFCRIYETQAIRYGRWLSGRSVLPVMLNL